MESRYQDQCLCLQLYRGTEPFKNAEKPDFKLEKVKLDSGVDANLIIGEENNKVKYEMNFIQNDIEYDFYAELPPTFFKENELNLKK